MLRSLASKDDTYVMGLFDCCREKLPEEMLQKMRNTGLSNLEDDIDDKKINIILSFGCPPSDTTPAKSTIAIHYFDHLKMRAS